MRVKPTDLATEYALAGAAATAIAGAAFGRLSEVLDDGVMVGPGELEVMSKLFNRFTTRCPDK